MVGILGNLLVDTKVSATSCGCLCCIPSLPLPNFGLFLFTCFPCFWGYCFSSGILVTNFLLALCTFGKLFLQLSSVNVSEINIYLSFLFCNKSYKSIIHIKWYWNNLMWVTCIMHLSR